MGQESVNRVVAEKYVLPDPSHKAQLIIIFGKLNLIPENSVYKLKGKSCYSTV